MLHQLSFSKKLIVILGSLCAVIMLVAGTSSYLIISQYIRHNIHEELVQLTERAYQQIETSIDVAIRNYLRGIAEKTRLMVRFYDEHAKQGTLTRDEAYQRAKALILDPEFAKIGDTGYLAGVDGAGVLVIHPKSEGVDASGLDFMQRAITMKNGYLEYPWKNVGEEQERDKAGWLAYFEPWDLILWASSYKSEFSSLVNLDDFRADILKIAIRESGYAYILDSRGNILVHPALEGENVYDSQDAQGHYFIREMCEKKNGQLVYPWQNPGEKKSRQKIAYYRYIEEMDWIVACSVYVDELYAPLRQLLVIMLLVSAGVLLGVTTLAFVLGTSIARPIQRLAGYAETLGQGNLQVTIPVDGHDEIGVLARTFNTMSANLRSFISQVQHSGLQVTSSATELAATAKQQEAIVMNQVASTDGVVQSIKEISDVSSELVETMQKVAEMSTQTAEFATQGQTDLARMEEAMRHMENASKTISSKLEAINAKAENITTVVTTITKVADQTNLLSLNASIEAEKAGEYGRGFTVVAREIRRLADQTAVATLDIDLMVKDMQSAVSAGVMEMDKFIAQVRHSAEDVERLSGQLANIINQVQSLLPSFENVNEAMQFQSGKTREINLAMRNLSEEMAQTQESLHETYGAIRQLNDAAQELQTEVLQFNTE